MSVTESLCWLEFSSNVLKVSHRKISSTYSGSDNSSGEAVGAARSFVLDESDDKGELLSG